MKKKKKDIESRAMTIDTEKMVGKVYYEIATWHNEDHETEEQRQEELKKTSYNIIQEILKDAFEQLEDEGVKTSTQTIKGEEGQNKKSENKGLLKKLNPFK